MLTWIREKFGTVIISGIIGFIAFVFVFSGVLSPKATQGLHSGAVAATVNGDKISIQEFSRMYNQRIEFFRNLAGGKLTDDQLKGFKIKEAVLRDLVGRKLVNQESNRLGIIPSDEQIREQIKQYPVFLNEDGKFDVMRYKQILEANRLSPGGFEKQVRDDLSAQQFQSFFRNRVMVSSAEAKDHFIANGDRREFRYVVLDSEDIQKGIFIDPAELKKFLADPAKQNLAKAHFEGKKTTLHKGKTFEQVQNEIARGLVAAEKIDEIKKLTDGVSEKIVATLKPDGKGDAAVDAVLKPYGMIKVRRSGMVSALGGVIPGLGEAGELMRDAFLKDSPLDKTAKRYQVGARTVIVVVTGKDSADLSKFPEQAGKTMAQLQYRREQEIVETWMRKLSAEAKVEQNEAVMKDDEGVPGVPLADPGSDG
ncbi:MAG: SurA N-terminal domain-containing protein [Bdellovibrionota bacterium]